MQEVAAAIGHYLPCFSHPYEVLFVRLDVAMFLVEGYAAFMSRQRRHVEAIRGGSPRGGGGGDGVWQDLPGGKRQCRIRSMDSLYAVMQSRGGTL